MPLFALLHLEGTMHGWGTVARERSRPASEYPTRSSIAGLLANALGWTYADGARTTALARTLRFAVAMPAAERARRLGDFQTARLRADDRGWTRRGIEGRGGDNADGTTIIRKEYLVGTAFRVAVGVGPDAPVSLDAIRTALATPARTLFLGRRSCLPTRPLFDGVEEGATPVEALRRRVPPPVLLWYPEGDGPAAGTPLDADLRDFASDRFGPDRPIRRWLVEEGADGG